MPTPMVCYWDEKDKVQKERPCTPAEIAELEAVKAEAAKPVVPQSVPMLNAHLTLIAVGWMPEVRAYLNALPGVEGEKARAYFDKAQTVRRDHPLVLAITDALDKKNTEVDNLFIAAGAME